MRTVKLAVVVCLKLTRSHNKKIFFLIFMIFVNYEFLLQNQAIVKNIYLMWIYQTFISTNMKTKGQNICYIYVQ